MIIQLILTIARKNLENSKRLIQSGKLYEMILYNNSTFSIGDEEAQYDIMNKNIGSLTYQ